MFGFLALALAGFFLLVIGSLFGHDHDFSHDLSHDVGHDLGHDVDQGGTISIFSIRVLSTFVMGFGAAGFICIWKYKTDNLVAALVGVGFGFVLGAVMWLVMSALARQQGTSAISLSSLIGSEGTLTVGIDAGEEGQVGITLGGNYGTYLAVTQDGTPIGKGKSVKVIRVFGNNLVVEKL